MKVCFVLPRFNRSPIGGYKIVYEYANRLSEDGYEVKLLFINEDIFVEHKVPAFLKKTCAYWMTQVEPRWFDLNKKIKKISGINDARRKLKNIDICVATGSETVSICERLFKNSKKYYLIQGFETWVMGEEKLFQTYNKGFRNIVVSSWLKDLVDKHSDTESILIKNPIDLSIYYPINPIDKRTPHTIGLLYHSNEDKGLKYSLESLRVLKYKYPDLKVFMFGTSEPKEEIPGLVEYIKNATQEETVRLYNEVSVFMCSAIVEGYGLTAMEAMACGAAVASSNYEGIHEYGIEGYNCLLSPVKDIDSMVNNVSKFFDDDQFRILIANQGVQSLQSFDWEMAYIKFKNVIDN